MHDEQRLQKRTQTLWLLGAVSAAETQTRDAPFHLCERIQTSVLEKTHRMIKYHFEEREMKKLLGYKNILFGISFYLVRVTDVIHRLTTYHATPVIR